MTGALLFLLGFGFLVGASSQFASTTRTRVTPPQETLVGTGTRILGAATGADGGLVAPTCTVEALVTVRQTDTGTGVEVAAKVPFRLQTACDTRQGTKAGSGFRFH